MVFLASLVYTSYRFSSSSFLLTLLKGRSNREFLLIRQPKAAVRSLPVTGSSLISADTSTWFTKILPVTENSFINECYGERARNIVKPAASDLEGTICILSCLSLIYYENLVCAGASATLAEN